MAQVFDLDKFDSEYQVQEEQFTIDQLELILNDESESLERLKQLQIDIYKKKKRTQQDVQLLVKLTMKMDYFIKINSKKGNIENDLHRKICQNLIFFFRKKGEFLFLQGDPPDYFYICIKGKSVTLVDIMPDELAKKRKPENNPMLVHGLSQDLTNVSKNYNRVITIRYILLIRFFQKAVLKLMKAIDLMNISKSGSKKQVKQRDKILINKMEKSEYRKSLRNSVQIKNSAVNRLFCENLYHNIRYQYNNQIKNLIDLDDIRYSFRLFDENVIKHFWPVQFQSGNSFGELGFINKRPRSASILALEESAFGVLDQKGYEASVVESDKKRIRQNIEFIQGILFEKGVQVSNERISKISFFFKKIKYQLSNTVYQQGEQQKELYFMRKGEVEVTHSVTTNIGEQDFRVTMLGPNEFIDDDDYFCESPFRTYNAKVISLKCTLFMIKKDGFDKILKDNRDIQQFLRQKWLNKKDFLHERLKKYMNFRFRDQIKLPMDGIQKYGKYRGQFSVQKLKEIENFSSISPKIYFQQPEQQLQLNLKLKNLHSVKNFNQNENDDFTKMCDALPQRRALKLKSMVLKNQETQKVIGGKDINVKQINFLKNMKRELFLMTKDVGNFQLALRNFKNGKALNWNPQNDEAKLRSLVQNRLGRKQSVPKIDLLQNCKSSSSAQRLQLDYNKSPNQTNNQTFYIKDAVQYRTLSQDIPWNYIRQFNNTQSSEDYNNLHTLEVSDSDLKNKFIHLKDLKKEHYQNKKQMFKNANLKVSKFFQHLQCSKMNQSISLICKDPPLIQPINNIFKNTLRQRHDKNNKKKLEQL